MKLFPGTPDMIDAGPVGKKGPVEMHACCHPGGEKKKIPGCNGVDS